MIKKFIDQFITSICLLVFMFLVYVGSALFIGNWIKMVQIVIGQ